jgi:starch-binding outer membrane protein, SusD/RagB family
MSRLKIVLLMPAMIACSSITDIDTRDVLEPDRLNNQTGALTLRAGAITRFTESFVLPTDDRGQVGASGAISDEFTSTFNNRFSDQRIIADPFDASYPGEPRIHQARMSLQQAITAMQRYAPTPPSRIGHLFALLGYTEIFLAETMCSGIALSSVVDLVPQPAPAFTTVQVLERAVADFDSALTYAADSARILNLARVGKGRALLDLARFTDAAAAVSAVPTSYSYATEHSASVQQNFLFQAMNTSRSVSVSDREGGNGLDFRSANDPRVPTRLVGKGVDGITDAYAFTKFTSLASPVVLASGIEARLIEAETQLKQGDASGALTKLNQLRTTTPGLAPLAIPATTAAQVDLLFRERAFWMFATGHRQGDLRRLVRQYGRNQESVFPTGQYRAGLVYGNAVAFAPVPAEANNPNSTGCLNRDP